MDKAKYNIIMLISLLLCNCTRQVENAQLISTKPNIFPDYIGVTIPVGIAPMNFEMVSNDVELMDVVVRGSKGGEIHCQGKGADFDIEEWHELIKQNVGGEISFTVCVLKAAFSSPNIGKAKVWYRYDDFKMYISTYSLDDFGLTYRRIPPGYEVGGNMGIYQRNIHNFDEFAILEETAVPGQCMNCHTANRCSANQFLIHLRGDMGGTVIQNEGKQTWLNTKTDSTKVSCGYSYWHPSGNYIASSINSVHQLFFVRKERRIEVFDTMSDVLVIDARTNELILNPKLMQPDWLETYPVFSFDGKTLYFSSARKCELPTFGSMNEPLSHRTQARQRESNDYNNVRYSLCKIAFDSTNGTYGERVDTLLNADLDLLSYTYPRPSYDGKWLMYNVSNHGNFPVNNRDSELWLMNISTGDTRPLEEVNSNDSDSFHNWSSNSHWFVFSSRRGDGMYNLAYISSIDDKGKATKPFLLPQRSPKKYYHELFDSFNCPDFTREKVEFDVIDGVRNMNKERVQVRVRW